MTRSEDLFARARTVIPGGVDSPVRAFGGVGGTPVFFDRGEGAFLIDVDGNRYVDLVQSWGALLFGHARPEIVALKAYEHAAWEPTLERLHANELPWRSFADESLAGLNRYPEPQPRALVERLASLYDVGPESVLVGRGSDEAIDLLVRGFCRAVQDSVVICPPTFGMYSVAARIQGAETTTHSRSTGSPGGVSASPGW